MDNLLSFAEPFFQGSVLDAADRTSREKKVMMIYLFADGAEENATMDAVFNDVMVADKLASETVRLLRVLF